MEMVATQPHRRLSGMPTVRYSGRWDDVVHTDHPGRPCLQEYVPIHSSAEYRLNAPFSICGRVEKLLEEIYEAIFSVATSGGPADDGIRPPS